MVEVRADADRARAGGDGARPVSARAEMGGGRADPVATDARPAGSELPPGESDAVAFERESGVNATDSL
jgi:hypothetical protein